MVGMVDMLETQTPTTSIIEMATTMTTVLSSAGRPMAMAAQEVGPQFGTFIEYNNLPGGNDCGYNGITDTNMSVHTCDLLSDPNGK